MTGRYGEIGPPPRMHLEWSKRWCQHGSLKTSGTSFVLRRELRMEKVNVRLLVMSKSEPTKPAAEARSLKLQNIADTAQVSLLLSLGSCSSQGSKPKSSRWPQSSDIFSLRKKDFPLSQNCRLKKKPNWPSAPDRRAQMKKIKGRTTRKISPT